MKLKPFPLRFTSLVVILTFLTNNAIALDSSILFFSSFSPNTQQSSNLSGKVLGNMDPDYVRSELRIRELSDKKINLSFMGHLHLEQKIRSELRTNGYLDSNWNPDDTENTRNELRTSGIVNLYESHIDPKRIIHITDAKEKERWSLKRKILEEEFQWGSSYEILSQLEMEFERLLSQDNYVPPAEIRQIITSLTSANILLGILDQLPFHSNEIKNVLDELTNENFEFQDPLGMVMNVPQQYWHRDDLSIRDKVSLTVSLMQEEFSGEDSLQTIDLIEFLRFLTRLSSKVRKEMKIAILNLRGRYERLVTLGLMREFSFVKSFKLYRGIASRPPLENESITLNVPSFFTDDYEWALVYANNDPRGVVELEVPIEAIVGVDRVEPGLKEDKFVNEFVIKEGTYFKVQPRAAPSTRAELRTASAENTTDFQPGLLQRRWNGKKGKVALNTVFPIISHDLTEVKAVAQTVQSIFVGSRARSELRRAMNQGNLTQMENRAASVFDRRFNDMGFTPVIGAHAMMTGRPVAVVAATRSEFRMIQEINQTLGKINFNGRDFDPILPAETPEAAAKLLRSELRINIVNYIYPEGFGISPQIPRIFNGIVEFKKAAMEHLEFTVQGLLEARAKMHRIAERVAQMA